MISLTYGIKKKKLIDTERRLKTAKGRGGEDVSKGYQKV